MTQPTPTQARTHRLYSHLNQDEWELFLTARDLCGYKTCGTFIRDILCGFTMNAIAKFSTPKIVDEVLTESINNH